LTTTEMVFLNKVICYLSFQATASNK